MVLIQRVERLVLAYPEIESTRVYQRSSRRQKPGGDRVRFPLSNLETVTDRPQISEIVGEYGVLPLYRLLGYFSILGLLRVHTMLGDFTLALKSMENVELNQKVFTRLHLPSSKRLHLTLMNYTSKVLTHPSDRMPRLNLLLRRVLLHDAQAVHRRDSHIRDDPEPHPPHATIPHAELPIRSNQQNGRQDVRPVRDLQRFVSQPIGR